MAVIKRTLPLLALLLLSATPAHAVPGGFLRVLMRGYWVCETQGDAVAPPVPLMQDSFRVIADSSYRTTANETGTYLLLGDALTMTGGPFKGRRYTLVGQGILHPLDAAGKPVPGRCARHASATELEGDTGQN